MMSSDIDSTNWCDLTTERAAAPLVVPDLRVQLLQIVLEPSSRVCNDSGGPEVALHPRPGFRERGAQVDVRMVRVQPVGPTRQRRNGLPVGHLRAVRTVRC